MTPLPHSIAARAPDPMTAPTLRGGVMGTGRIADRFIRAVRAGTIQRITSPKVTSRRP